MMEKAALLGGRPIRNKFPEHMAWPTGGALEREALLRVLKSGIWSAPGKENIAFAERYAAYCQTRYALPVTNGTTAIELILRALEIGYGDEVIVPPYTFSASVHAIVLTGAKPVFADVELDTFCLSAESAESVITPRTRAILAVHLGGRPFAYAALKNVADRHGLYLIEDAAHAHGSEWCSHRCGSLGRAAAFSFQQSKNLGCGEGGAITTNDDKLYERLWNIHNHGRHQNSSENYAYLGTNGRLAEWQCALLQARMERLDRDIDTRMHAADILNEKLGRLPYISLLKPDERITRNSLHLYCFLYHEEALQGLPRSVFVKAVVAENVAMLSQGYCEPVYEMGMLYSDDFKRMTGCTFENPKTYLPNNECLAHKKGCWFYQSTLLGTNEEIDMIVQAFEKIAANAGALMSRFTKDT